MKNDLMNSIQVLADHSEDPEKYQRLLKVLDPKDIPDTAANREKIVQLIYLMFLYWQDIRTNPYNKQLRELGKNCVEQTPKLTPTTFKH